MLGRDRTEAQEDAGVDEDTPTTEIPEEGEGAADDKDEREPTEDVGAS